MELTPNRDVVRALVTPLALTTATAVTIRAQSPSVVAETGLNRSPTRDCSLSRSSESHEERRLVRGGSSPVDRRLMGPRQLGKFGVVKTVVERVDPHRLDQADAGASDASTRERVLHLLLAHGATRVADLAERLDLTPAAVRRHIASLEAAGLITWRAERVYGQRGRGRPAKVYVLTDEGRSSFYQAYDDLALQAIRTLHDTVGPSAVRALAEARVARVEHVYTALRAERPELGPVEALAMALSEDGYIASIEPVRSGDQICQHHCPVAEVARQFPLLCQVETEVFAKLLDSHVQRLATIAHGDGVCTTHVPHAVSSSAHPTEPVRRHPAQTVQEG